MNIISNLKIVLNTALTMILINVIAVAAYMFNEFTTIIVVEFMALLLAFLISVNFTNNQNGISRGSFKQKTSDAAILDSLGM